MAQARHKTALNLVVCGIFASALLLGGCGSSQSAAGYNPPDLYFSTAVSDQVEGAGTVYATLEFEERPPSDVIVSLTFSGETSMIEVFSDRFRIEPADLDANNQLTFRLVNIKDDLDYSSEARSVKVVMAVDEGPAESSTGGVIIFNIIENDPAPTTLIGIASLTPSATVPLN